MNASCPECGTVMRTAAESGTKVRCPKCKHVFRLEDEEEDQPVAKPRPSAVKTTPKEPPPRTSVKSKNPDPPTRSRTRVVDEEEEKEKESPRRRSGKKRKSEEGSKTGLYVALGATGMLALGGIITVLVLVLGGKKDDNPTPVVRNDDKDKDKDKNKDKDKPDDKGKPDDKNPPKNPIPREGLDNDVLDKVKKATVYIRVFDARGMATGSGFFGITGNLVLTNAHVLGMLEERAKAPDKVEIVLNSGLPGSKTYIGQIVTVDRASDLAVLRAIPTQPNEVFPPALKVQPAVNLRETQKVYVVGYPFGEAVNRNVTINTSTVSSLHHHPEDNGIDRVQVDGGMHPGNSGGPLIDAQGDVLGVAVSGIRGTRINFAIPGEHVSTLVNGRLSRSVVGEPMIVDGKLVARVKLSTLDPLAGIKNLSVDWWYGSPGDPRLPSDAQPGLLPSDGVRTTTVCNYDPATATATADLPLTTMPPRGKVLWCQPSIVDLAGKQRWVSASGTALREPIEPIPATLTREFALSRSRIDITSLAKYELKTSIGSRVFDKNIVGQFYEDLREITPAGEFVKYFFVAGRFEFGLHLDGKPMKASPRLQRIVQDVGSLGVIMRTRRDEFTLKTQPDLRRVPNTSRNILGDFGDQISRSLDFSVMPVPDGEVRPGATWEAVKKVTFEVLDDELVDDAQMTYTYRGVRTVDGKKYAYVEVTGKLRGGTGRISTLQGLCEGEVVFDLAERRISEVRMKFSSELAIHFGDEDISAIGSVETVLKRGSPQTLPTNLIPLEGSPDVVKPPIPPVTAREIRRFEGQESPPNVAAVSADGRFFASGGNTAAVCIWDAKTGKLVQKLAEPGIIGGAMQFSRDGEFLLVGATDRGKGCEAKVYRTSDGSTASHFKGHTDLIRAGWISADGSVAGTAGNDGTVCIWDTKTGMQMHQIKANLDTLNGLAVSADLKYVVTSGRSTAIFNVATGQKTRDVSPPTGVLITMPDGKSFLAGGPDGTARVISFSDGKAMRTYGKHRSHIEHVSISADGKRILTSDSNSVNLWDASKVQPVAVIQGTFGLTRISADGKAFVSTREKAGVWYELPK